MMSVIETEPSLESLALEAIQKAFSVAVRQVAQADSFCIYGAGEVGRILLDLCQQKGVLPDAFLDDLASEHSIAGIPVHPVKEGVEAFQPTTILLATIRSPERMRISLDELGFTGELASVRDANAHLRAPHSSFIITPKEQIQSFHNAQQGKRAFVIGNGPSLLKTDPRRLMKRGDVTFAANNIFLLDGFEPTYYTAIDRVLTQDRAEQINALPWTKFFPHLVSGWITNGVFLKASQRDWPEAFSTDISECLEIDFTVTFSLLQIALYMGCNPVYLIGVDHTYTIDERKQVQEGRIITSLDDDPNHFHPGYFGKGYRWTSPPMEKLEACYQLAAEAYQTQGRELYNATAGGALEVVPRVNFEDLLDS